jgi:AN1-type zinc finger protein 2
MFLKKTNPLFNSSDHFNYKNHSCQNANKRDFQVPVCPLCGEPVPTPRDVSADVSVGKHIDEFCRSEKKKVFLMVLYILIAS